MQHWYMRSIYTIHPILGVPHRWTHYALAKTTTSHYLPHPQTSPEHPVFGPDHAREHTKRSRQTGLPSDNVCDLGEFPTGGGSTAICWDTELLHSVGRANLLGSTAVMRNGPTTMASPSSATVHVEQCTLFWLWHPVRAAVVTPP